MVWSNGYAELQEEKMQEFFHDIILSKFPYGFKPSSLIDRRKFRRGFEADYNVSFPIDEGDIEAFAALADATCVGINNKYYALSPQGRRLVDALLTELKTQGVNTLFFSQLHTAHYAVFREAGIDSAEILAQVLRKYYAYPCTEEYFQFHTQAFEIELIQAWGTRKEATLAELCRLLPYVSEEFLRNTLREGAQFFYSGKAYFLVDAILFDEQEVRIARLTIQRQCLEKGFLYARELSLPHTCALNPELAPNLLLRLLLRYRFKGNYHWACGIISPSAKPLSTKEVMQRVGEQLGRFRFAELIAQLDGLEGSQSYWLAQVQKYFWEVDKETFVRRSDISFEVKEIDALLEQLTQGKALPLLAIKSFGLFPAVFGYAWNHFLLASYLRFASQAFTLARGFLSVQCTGIIIPRSREHEELSLFAAEAALAAGIEAKEDVLAQYLVQTAILARKSRNFVTKTLAAMQALQR